MGGHKALLVHIHCWLGLLHSFFHPADHLLEDDIVPWLLQQHMPSARNELELLILGLHASHVVSATQHGFEDMLFAHTGRHCRKHF